VQECSWQRRLERLVLAAWAVLTAEPEVSLQPAAVPDAAAEPQPLPSSA
jgi:hypothetical protein